MALKLLSRNLIQNVNAVFTRSYNRSYSNAIIMPNSSLYSKISPLGEPGTSVVPELENWVNNGKKVRVGELQRIIRDLRKRSRFTQALEVSEWMGKKEICLFSPVEHAVQLDLIGRVRGIDSAESYFNGLRNQDKNEKTYGALLSYYVRQRLTDKSISHFEKMKKMGFASTPLVYNDIMCLYTKIKQLEKVPDVLTEMKERIAPDNFSYRICINSYGARGDHAGMEKILNEMESQEGIVMDWNTYAVVASFYCKAGLTDKAISALRKAEEKLDNKDRTAYHHLISHYATLENKNEVLKLWDLEKSACKRCINRYYAEEILDNKDRTGYHHLISHYATLGNKNEVLKLWDLEKSACKRCINRDYINILSSLVKLGEFGEAVKILKEWESSGNFHDIRVPNIVITGYCEKGLHDEAKAMLEDLMEKGKATKPKVWGAVAKGYLDEGKVAKAYDCIRVALCIDSENKGWKPSPKVLTSILSWLGNKASVQDVESFVASMQTAAPMSKEMYVALLKANKRAGKDVDRFLEVVKNHKLDEDEEIKKTLSEWNVTI